MENLLALITTYAGVCIVVFLFFAILWFIVLIVLRPLVLWYLKIYSMTDNQKEMNDYLSELVSQNKKLIDLLSKQHYKNTDASNKEYEKYMPK